MRLFRTLGFVVGLITVAGCGGDSSGDDASSPTSGAEATAVESSAAPGDTASPAPTSAETNAPAPTSGGGALDLVPEGATDILGNPAGQGFVELEGVRYDFVLDGACRDVFGALQAAGSQAPDGEAKVDALIPPEDWETDTAAGWDPPYVQVDLGNEQWRAEMGLEVFVDGETVELSADQSAVTSFTNDGSFTAGVAVFYDEFGVEGIETRTGSFQFFCPG